MVYPGKPSTGCQTCRSRRIKCDEAHPHCNACVRSGRECPGYPHPLDVMLRPQKAFTRKSNSSSPTALSRRHNNVDVERGSTTFEFLCPPCLPQHPTPLASIIHPQIPDGLYLPMEDNVTALFFNSYLYAPRDPLIRQGSMDLLPQMYGAAPPDSHLRMSALAVAFFSVAAWTRQEHLLESAQQCFVKALSRTRRALQGDFEQRFDEILMTLLTLHIYEQFTSIKENKPSPKAHLRGAIALINSCGPERRNSPLSDTLSNAVQAEVINIAMDGTSLLPQTPEVWPLSFPMPQLASSRLSIISTAVVRLRVRWMEVSTGAGAGAADLNEVEGVLSEAHQIDDQLVDWTHTLPKHWDPMPAVFIPQSVRNAGVYQNRSDCYTDFWIAETWNSYRISRLVIQNVIYRCMNMLASGSDDAESTMVTIHTLATDICASVPFYLGSQNEPAQINVGKIEYPMAAPGRVNASHQQTAPLLGGWIIMYTLESLCLIDNLLEEQVDWAKAQVQRVQQIYTSGLTRR
ncbi:hypothetical protein BDW59DRAFT_6891 [Aspergillus cavernicola]|uniref:Zn(2)-C6 fungal-type domain-containing protein n=1 Tax=Aspergillus cavernicola TaxID=176166 RepID=A0ABR4IWB2_9EURO